VRTRSRHEKQVHAQLADRPGIGVFLPLRERRSRWKDRVKRVQEPLFPGYCFARFRHPDRLRVLKAVGVVGLVGLSGEPEPIPDSEIEAIRTLAGSRLSYEPFPSWGQFAPAADGAPGASSTISAGRPGSPPMPRTWLFSPR
jgi:transcription termination/antitermination protein NusG